MLYGLFVPIRVAHLCYSELRFGAQPLGRAALSSGRPLENSGLLGRLKSLNSERVCWEFSLQVLFGEILRDFWAAWQVKA